MEHVVEKDIHQGLEREERAKDKIHLSRTHFPVTLFIQPVFIS